MSNKAAVLEECAKMVVGMVDYYSGSKVAYADVYAVLKPLLDGLGKDDPAYVAYAKAYRAEVEAQRTPDE